MTAAPIAYSGTPFAKKLGAVDAIWSELKLVIRRELR